MTFFGFRRGGSAKEVFLLLKDEVLCPPSGSPERILLALDVQKAFDTISHSTILKGLENVGCGERIFHYVQGFPRYRTATIALGTSRPLPYELPRGGTPQGAILSPLLFHIGMRKLALQLQEDGYFGVAIYADDITLWASKGSYGDRQNTLERALDTVESYTKQAGMKYARRKSEYQHI